MSTRLLWIGLAAPDDLYKELIRYGYPHTAAHNAQKNLIEGIEHYTGIDFDFISGYLMRPYPKGKLLYTKKHLWKNGVGNGLGTSCLNIKYVDVLFRAKKMKSACASWAKEHADDEVIVFVYSAINAYVQAALEIKKINKEAKIYLIITDLPQYMELRPSRLKKTLKDLNWKSLREGINNCDGWILFTKHMISYLQLPENRCMVMEGSVNICDIKNEDNRYNDISNNAEKVVVMYSGSLGLKYGIPELLNAFDLIHDEKYELWITGHGDAEKLIDEYCKHDTRIKMFGFLSSRNELIDLQRKATALINMRLPSEPASAYCFPSKLFDYMLTGKPVLSFRIDGIPDEYYRYLVTIKSPDPIDIKQAIFEIGNMTSVERNRIGKKSREFIIDNKNNIEQARRICEFVGLPQREELK